jgi:HEAT repeat protein
MCARVAAVAMMVALSVAWPARADDDEPEFLGKKFSEWERMALEGKAPEDRRRGLIGVEQIGHSRSRKAVPTLVKALQHDRDEGVRAAAARAVGRAVAKAFADAREDKADELPRMDDARNALVGAMRAEKKNEAIREAAALALGDIGPDARAAAGALGTALKDPSSAVVRAAASSIRRMAKEAKDAQADVQSLLADKTTKDILEARIDCALTLGILRHEVSAAVGSLKAALTDAANDERLRRAAAESLGKLGKEAGSAAADLGAVLTAEKSSESLRLASMTALELLGAEAKPAIPHLVKAISDPERIIRCLAMQVLGRMGKDLDSQRKEAVAAMLKAVDDANVEVRVAALETLGAIAEDGLADLTDRVVEALDRILRREARKELLAAAKSARDKIRPPKK